MTTLGRRDVLKAGALLPAALALPACNKSEAAATDSCSYGVRTRRRSCSSPTTWTNPCSCPIAW